MKNAKARFKRQRTGKWKRTRFTWRCPVCLKGGSGVSLEVAQEALGVHMQEKHPEVQLRREK